MTRAAGASVDEVVSGSIEVVGAIVVVVVGAIVVVVVVDSIDVVVDRVVVVLAVVDVPDGPEVDADAGGDGAVPASDEHEARPKTAANNTAYLIR